jgi:hypothetical protein
VAVGVDLTASPFASMVPRPVVPVPGLWTFHADHTVGGASLGPVRVSAFTCTSKLSDFGTGSVTVLLPCGLDEARLLRLWSWRLWALYEGTPVWCGVPTGIQDAGTQAVTLTLAEITGYLVKRMFDVKPNKVYTQVEQCAIAAEIAAPLADVGVRIVTSPATAFLRDRTYDYLGNTRAELLVNLAQVIDGPEFRAEYASAAGGPQCTLRIAHPRVGSGASGLGVTMPGSALGYSAAWDADQLRTRTYALGEADQSAGTENPPKPVAIADRPQADLPRLDATDDYPGVTVASTLTERAATGAAQHAVPALKLTASPSEAYPDLRGYGVGDDVTVHVITPLLPDGLTVTGRLVQVDIDAAAATAAWTVSVAVPPPQTRESLTGRLGRLDRTQAAMFRAGPKAEIA